jgi:hypothetical protein
MRRRVALLLAAILAAAALTAPAPEAGAQPGPPADRLPYGVPVPPGQEVTRPPTPYDRARHGPPVPNTQPEANQAGNPDVQLPERPQPPRRPRTGPPDPGSPEGVPGSGDRGLWIRGGTGVHAKNDAQTDLVIPGSAVGTTIYAPTHMAAGYTCLETVTAHWYYAGMAGTAHGHGFWDWCEADGAGGWQVFETMDATWRQKYVRPSGGENKYWTEVFQEAGTSCWWGLLYNFEIGWWEGKAHICGAQPYGHAVGWTMWESHHLMDQARVCPRFPDIAAGELQVLSGGKWAPLSGSNSGQLGPYGLCWDNGTYQFSFSTSSGLGLWQALTSGRGR